MTQAGFQDFQRAFADHLRDPRRAPMPAGLPARRVAVYRELLFNNLCGFLDTCFPVARATLGERRWRRLNRAFYRDWPLHTPWFREIPREFVRYLIEAKPAGPPWLPELAHHEWVELALDVLETAIPEHDPDGDLLARPVILNPARLNLAYRWPVHRIGPQYRPRKPVDTHLLAYRGDDDAVRFVEINAVTARLLALLSEAPTAGEAACRRIAEALHHPDPARIVAFGAALLDGWRRDGIVLGTLPAPLTPRRPS